MVPHKTQRGAKALERIKVFEGVPPPYDKTKRMVVPTCLKVACLQHGHRYCRLADLSTQVRTHRFAPRLCAYVLEGCTEWGFERRQGQLQGSGCERLQAIAHTASQPLSRPRVLADMREGFAGAEATC